MELKLKEAAIYDGGIIADEIKDEIDRRVGELVNHYSDQHTGIQLRAFRIEATEMVVQKLCEKYGCIAALNIGQLIKQEGKSQ